jgi:SAM-dependent methyltransferase
MKWTQAEIELLSPVLKRIRMDLEPIDGKNILVLCSAGGDVAFWLAKQMKQGKVTGLELDQALLARASQLAKEQGLENLVEFRQAEKTHIPFPSASFDALVSEFIIFPTPVPTEIGQPEMARVLKSGGMMVLTDVIVTNPIPEDMRADFQAIGLDYLCEGTQDDFRRWMEETGLISVEIVDLTSTVRRVWELRRRTIPMAEEHKGYVYLLDDPNFGLGEAIFYIYVCGKKP